MALLEIRKEWILQLKDCLVYKNNAGKKVGNYHTSKLWSITNKPDAIFISSLTKDTDTVVDILEAIKNHVAFSVLVVDEDEE